MKINLAAASLWCACGVIACASPDDALDGATDDATQALVGGSPAPNKTDVPLFRGNCSSVLIHPSYVLTAGHCINYNNNDIGFGEGISIISPGGLNVGDFRIRRAHTFGHLGNRQSPDSFVFEQTPDGLTSDLAVAQLIDPVPPSLTSAMEVATTFPPNGSQATLLGFGCNNRSTGAGSLVRRSFSFPYGNTTRALCPGDSGGPGVFGDGGGWVVWGVNAGTVNGDDRFASAVFYEDKIMRVIQAWEGTALEAGFDRVGHDFSIFDLASPDPEGCRRACQSASQCRAFTYVQPGIYGPNARCFLKDAIQGWRPCGPCTSGTVLSEERSIDRPGGDYSSFFLAEPRPELCLAACGRDPACRAYSYADPGVFGGQAACFLKSSIPAQVADGVITSGVKRGFEPGYDRNGRTYSTSQTTSTNPDTCRASCAQAGRCRAFTFVAPGVIGTKGECRLKDTWGDPFASAGMTSGVKRGLELNTDRIGGDLRHFDLATASGPETCQAECAKDAACVAFTFGPAGYVNSKPHCWLKSSIAPGSYNEALVSGLKGADFF